MSSKLLAGRYELIEKIGEGGMAVVYKAKDRLLNRYIAIKILRPEFTKDAQFVESFKRESQAAAGLQHPNIISIYDVGREGDINYIVMELVDGRPLSEVIEDKAPMDYKVAIDIARQVASALSVAHKHNIIHRDIKPHNIMITKEGMAKLGDFGIAKAVSSSTMVADTNKIIGSVHYFSPEQARGGKVDERSDIYSLGIVLYEMLTGVVPFDGDNPVTVALMHINEDIKPPSKIVPGIPPQLEKLVMKATDKFQDNRYRTVDELLEDLDNIEFVTKVVGNTAHAGSVSPEDSEPKEDIANLAKESKQVKKKKKKKNTSSEGMSSKKKAGIIIGSIAGALIVLLIVLYATGVLGGKSKEVEVPDLTDMTISEAKDAVKKLDLKIKKGDEVPSPDIEEGHIVSQTPKKGSKVQRGKTITVNISSGKKNDEKGVVPSLVNKKYTSREDINAILQEYGYTLGSVTEEESDVEEGVIISQNPKAGSTAKSGSSIDIVVSKGKKKPQVPSLTGMTVDQAKAAIQSAGFTVGNISYGESNIYQGGLVMEQNPAAGSELEAGSAISIVVAKEQEVPQPPADNTNNNGNQQDNNPNAGGENQDKPAEGGQTE